jgi:hypothetical protein
MPANVKEILEEYSYLYGENASWKSYYEDLADFGLPRKAWVVSYRSTGERMKFNFLYDSTAIRGLQKMAAGFHSNLTNPAIKWHGFETDDPDLMKAKAVQEWLYKVELIQYRTYANSNFDTAMQEFYMDSGCFGTGDIYTTPDPRFGSRYTAVPCEETEFAEDDSGRVVRVWRCRRLPAWAAFRKWGAQAGESVIKAMEDPKKRNEKFEFIQYVAPRYERDASKVDNINMPYQSCWISRKDKHLIRESGFTYLPHAVGRFWKDPTDPRGFSPMMNVLCDVKLANAQNKTVLRGGMKKVDPGYSLPSRGYMLPINLNPGGLTFRDAKLSKDNRMEILPVNQGDVGLGVDLLTRTQQAIEDGLFLPLFQTLADIGKNMPIIEVQKRIADNLALLGPVLGRYNHDTITPTVLSTFQNNLVQGKIPPLPAQLKGKTIRPIYYGQLARAQRQSEIADIDQWLNEIGEIAKFDPNAMDIPDIDKAIYKLGKFRNIDPDLYRDPKVIQQRRQMRLQQQQAEQRAAILKQGAEAAHHVARAGKAAAEAQDAAQGR